MFKSEFFISYKSLYVFLAIKKRQVSKNRKKACKIWKNYPINKKIPGAHLQMLSNQHTHFQKKKNHEPIFSDS